jgi:hypothetical protein
MKNIGRKWCYPLITLLLSGILAGLWPCAHAETRSYAALKAQIAGLAEQTRSVLNEQDPLLRQNRALGERINAAKRQLQRGGNLLMALQLQNDLKASRALSDQIQALDKRVHGLTGQSVSLKRQLVGALDVEIEALSRQVDATRNAKQRTGQLEQILQLQREKEACQQQIAADSNELLLGLDITLVETDGPDEIQQKIAILQDQRDIVQTKIQSVEGQIQESRKKLSLQRNMLELLRTIGRGEEDEFDFDRSLRIAELQEAIVDLETALELLQAKQEIWGTKEKALVEKTGRFSTEARKLIQPSTKGDSK